MLANSVRYFVVLLPERAVCTRLVCADFENGIRMDSAGPCRSSEHDADMPLNAADDRIDESSNTRRAVD